MIRGFSLLVWDLWMRNWTVTVCTFLTAQQTSSHSGPGLNLITSAKRDPSTSLIIDPSTIAPCSSQSSCDFTIVWLFFTCLHQVGLVYMFNLIVGTGALTMPRAFATAGWVVSLALITFLGFMRYSSRGNSALAVKPETNVETSAQMGASAESDYKVTRAITEKVGFALSLPENLWAS